MPCPICGQPEQAIKDNISEGIYDFERRHTPIQKAVLATAVREIINKIGHRIKPRIQDIRDSLYRINELLGTEHDRVVLNKMARYIFYDWESIIKTPEEGRPHRYARCRS